MRGGRQLAWLLLIGLAVLGVIAWWRICARAPSAEAPSAGPPPDPRLIYQGPFRNLDPGVAYVGDEACTHCHETHAASYKRHPMGRSMFRIEETADQDRYDPTVRNPFAALGFQYQVIRTGNRVIHQETRYTENAAIVGQVAAEVKYVVGSGARGRSYIIDRDGYLFQSPISWFSPKGIWDLSPGYHKDHLHLERPIQAECLYCHANRALPVEETFNRFTPPVFQGFSIGCERCHGPGALHVAERRESDPPRVDPTIVNPRHLPPTLREAVCQQCHLLGESSILRAGRDLYDYRPGLPLHQFFSIFVRPADMDDKKAVSHVEQMYASRCFQESAGKLGCISCHDPHEKPDPSRRDDHFRERCLRCHQEAGAALPSELRAAGDKERPCRLGPVQRRAASPGDSCIVCHMPRFESSDIAHTAATDHRVLRKPGAEGHAGPARRPIRPGEAPLVLFHKNLVEPGDPWVARDLGVAMASMIQGPDAARAFGAQALTLLERAVQLWPGDLKAWDGQGGILFHQQKDAQALAAFEQSLAQAPRRERSLSHAAILARELGDLDKALRYVNALLEVNPYRSRYHVQKGLTHARRKEWLEAAAAARKALQLNPASIEARQVLISSLVRLGKTEEAKTEYDRLLAFDPPGKALLARWFDDLKRVSR